MTVTIKKSDSPEAIQRKIRKVSLAAQKKAKTKRKFDPFEFLGKLKGVFGDGLTYQKKVRDEWSG